MLHWSGKYQGFFLKCCEPAPVYEENGQEWRADCFRLVFAGIFAYLNFLTPRRRSEIIEILLTGLKRLEYRGYDSAGAWVTQYWQVEFHVTYFCQWFNPQISQICMDVLMCVCVNAECKYRHTLVLVIIHTCTGIPIINIYVIQFQWFKWNAIMQHVVSLCAVTSCVLRVLRLPCMFTHLIPFIHITDNHIPFVGQIAGAWRYHIQLI